MTEHKTLAAALAAFQAELPSVKKGATGQVPGKGKYKYADLSDLSATVLPLLGKHGLSWMAMPTMTSEGMLVLRYELLHTSGETRTGDFPLHGSDNWSIGSSLTYGRRFCLSAVTGVAADEDDDGVAGNSGVQPQRRQAPAKPADSPVEKAKVHLRELVAARELDGNQVADRYKQQYGEELKAATDPTRVQAFTKLIEGEEAKRQAQKDQRDAEAGAK